LLSELVCSFGAFYGEINFAGHELYHSFASGSGFCVLIVPEACESLKNCILPYFKLFSVFPSGRYPVDVYGNIFLSSLLTMLTANVCITFKMLLNDR